MRFALPALLLFAAVAPAAPVPITAGARVQLEALWADLDSHDHVKHARAALALVEHPHAVAFLAEKCVPAAATAGQLRAWMKDLNGDDAAAEAAFKQLLYFDPRLGLSLTEQIELATTDRAARRLIMLWEDWDPEALGRMSNIRLALDPRDESGQRVMCRHEQVGQKGELERYQTTIYPSEVEIIRPPGWVRVARAAEVLHLIDTPAARAALDRLAKGHPEALPTRTAAELRAVKPVDSLPANEHDAWGALLSGDRATRLRALLMLSRTPAAAKNLKGKLPAVSCTPEETVARLRAVASEDERVWRPAFDQLLYFHPLLALTPGDMAALANTDRGRAALVGVVAEGATLPDQLTVLPNTALSVERWSLRYWFEEQGREVAQLVPIHRLEQFNPRQWQRARLAIVALERMGTAEAKDVLKQLAGGHPAVRPTKEAKAALERLAK